MVQAATLSRWTMTWFAAALAFLIAAEALMAAGYGFPAVPAEAPESLVLVHMIAIGWLSLLMGGALFQFVPVLVGRHLQAPRLVLPALLGLILGLGCLLGGFLQLAGTLELGVPLLALAGVLLPSGFALAAWPIGRTLWQARPLTLPARFVAGGLACLAATAAMGVLLACVLSGMATAFELVALRTRLLPFHIAAGLGGWLGLTAIGASYRLLPMFLLSPEARKSTSRAVWGCGSAALLLLAIIAPLALALETGTDVVVALAVVLAAAALVFYGADLLFFYRHRRRKNVELNSKAAGVAFAMLFLSALVAAALLATGSMARHAGALLYFVTFGWLTGLGLSQLYKIVPFLTWLECYGPVMGRKPTPRVQDLVVERRAKAWFALYFVSVLTATGALLMDWDSLFRVAATGTLVATIAIVGELVLARLLFNVAAERRLPAGASRPHLFLPPLRHG